MTGIKFLLLAAALAALSYGMAPAPDAPSASRIHNRMTAVEVECKARQWVVGGMTIGCHSFADVRKLDLRDDNRRRSVQNSSFVQVRH